MKSISTLKLALRFTLGFGLIALIITALSTFSLIRVSQITTVVEQQNRLRTDKLERLYTAREALDQTGLAARNAFIFPDGERAREELDLLDKEKALYLDALTAMTPLFHGDEHFAKVRSGLMSMADELRRPRKYREAGQMEAYGKFLVEECSPLRRRIVADIAVVIKELQQQVDTESQRAEHLSVQSQSIILAVSAVAVLLSILIGWILTRSLLRQLGGEPEQVSAIARHIARGELTAEIPVKSGDTRSVMHAMQDMRDNLVKIVSDVRVGTEAINRAAGEIAAGNLNLSTRTEEQAASLEETAAAMEELTSTVARNTQNAEEANSLAISAASVAGDGGQAVARVVETMGLIDEAARRISDITSVIDGIAFQTNILALNAAVEAARAGEQGRGFAVVAAEVRALAQRSAGAAKEIKDLIGKSVDMVALGSRQAGEAGETMSEVVSGVQQMAGMMTEIMEASRQQSAGIVEVNQTILQIDGSTQQNATLVQQAASSAASLQHQADKLSGSVNFFQLGAVPAAVPLKALPSAIAPTNTPRAAAPKAAKPGAAPAETKEAPPRAAPVARAAAKSTGRALRTAPQPKPRLAPHQSDADWTEF
ncbi:methyl-accepting chemotaxis protein [Noviherbaspirillum pedocola]|uniref:Chemotaxis protein n=1 Tax=Noviherbaspirillum pedocola TaxID=2801341 RepID=A0A934W7B0_9BURK|nr:methyl-accepting chemotaxis protein [Noviherbaspirillum pedocola]MBK4736150.1 chemotaxis protein [Noviherbaspirillum pedocola]